jgi:hypothetical protein
MISQLFVGQFWMQNSVLGRLSIVDYMIEIWIWNLENFTVKFEVEICWKSEYFLKTSIPFLKAEDRMQANYNYLKTIKRMESFHKFIANFQIFGYHWLSLDTKIYAESRANTMFHAVLNWKRIQLSESARFAWIWEFNLISILNNFSVYQYR